MRLQSFLCIGLLLSSLQVVFAQQDIFKEIAPTYTLSAFDLKIPDKRLTINEILLDQEGYYWFTSNNGLWVYDGVSAIRYSNGNSKYPVLADDIGSNFNDLSMDSEGNLITSIWGKNTVLRFNPHIRGVKDVCRFNGAMLFEETRFGADEDNALYYTSRINGSEQMYLYKQISNDAVIPLFAIPKVDGLDDKIISLHFLKHRIFVLTGNYLYCLSKSGSLIKKISFRTGWPDWPYAYSDSQNFYIVNESAQKMYSWDFETNELKTFFVFPEPLPGIYTVFIVRDQTIVCFNSKTLSVYDLKNKTYQKIFTVSDPLFTEPRRRFFRIDVEDISMDKDGSFRLNSKKQLFRLEKNKIVSDSFKTNIEGLDQPPSTRGFTEDTEGNIYVTYYTAGIAIKKKRDSIFKVCTLPKNPLINFESTYSITAYKDKLIWNNTLLDFSANTIESLCKSLPYSHTTHYLKGDSLWFYTWFNDKIAVSDLAKKTVKTFEIDNSAYPKVRFSVINKLIADSKGKNLWAASNFNGITQLSKKGVVQKNYSTNFLKTNQEIGVTDLVLEPPLLWYGGSNGLGVFNTENKEVAIYKFPDGMDPENLVDRTVYFIEPLSDSEFYLGTDHGLILFNKKTKKYFELEQNNPLSQLEFNRASHFKASDGKFYMGSVEGVFSFYPDELRWKKDKIQEKTIRINLISIFTDAGKYKYISKDADQLKTLHLKPGDTSIEINFSVPTNYENPIYYSYRITGINNYWSEYSTKQEISLAGLPSGKFTLEIRTHNSSTHIKKISLIKAQYWYLRWYSQLGFITLFILLISILIRYRYNLRLQKERELAGLRTKISSDLHDDVGSILTAVAMQSEILEKNALPSETKRLQRITTLSRQAMGNMRDTVWSIDSKKDNIGSLLSRMKDYASDAFQDNERLSFHFVKGKEINVDQKLNPFIRQNVYLIYKEAITNCLKHCNGDKVEIRYSHSKNELFLEITDNGSASKKMKTSGLGLTNMELRAKKMNGNLIINTENGFKIILRVPLT
ncbi:MAG: hypothetical protein KDC78_01625 [Aequorivita sp.]|nr:hypothetical protein [Aequorivita sp.]